MSEHQLGRIGPNTHPDGFSSEQQNEPFLEQICEFGTVEYVPVSHADDITLFLADLSIHNGFTRCSPEVLKHEITEYARDCAWWLSLNDLNVEPIVGETPRDILIYETLQADGSLTRTDVYNFSEVDFELRYYQNAARGVVRSLEKLHVSYGPVFEQFIRSIVFARFTEEPELARGSVDYYVDLHKKFLIISTEYIQQFHHDPTARTPAYTSQREDRVTEELDQLFNNIQPAVNEYYRSYINANGSLADHMVDRIESGEASSAVGQVMVALPQPFGLFLPTSIKP